MNQMKKKYSIFNTPAKLIINFTNNISFSPANNLAKYFMYLQIDFLEESIHLSCVNDSSQENFARLNECRFWNWRKCASFLYWLKLILWTLWILFSLILKYSFYFLFFFLYRQIKTDDATSDWIQIG